VVGAVQQAQLFQRVHGAQVIIVAHHAGDAAPPGRLPHRADEDVFQRGPPLEQHRLLLQQGNLPTDLPPFEQTLFQHVFPVPAVFPRGPRFPEREAFEQQGFPASARAGEGDDGARLKFRADAVKQDFAVVGAPGQANDLDHGCTIPPAMNRILPAFGHFQFIACAALFPTEQMFAIIGKGTLVLLPFDRIRGGKP